MASSTESVQRRVSFRLVRENLGLVRIVLTFALFLACLFAIFYWLFPSPKRQLVNMGIQVNEAADNPFDRLYKQFFSRRHFTLYTDQPNSLTASDWEEATQLINKLNGDKTFFLRYNSKIKNLESIQNCKQLRTFGVQVCEKIQTLKGLNDEMQLHSLTCSGCPNLVSLETTDPLSSVLDVAITSCPKLTDISDLNSMTNLNALFLTHGKELPDFSKLSSLTKLQRLNIGLYEQFSDLQGIEKLTQLKSLVLKGHTIPQARIDEIQKALPNTKITSIPKITE